MCRRSGAISLETHRPPPHTTALCLLGRSPSPGPDLSPASVSRCPCPGYESSAEWSRVSWCLGSFSLVDETTCLKPELRKKELLSSQFAGVSVHYRLAVRQHRAEGHSSWWRRTVKVSRAGAGGASLPPRVCRLPALAGVALTPRVTALGSEPFIKSGFSLLQKPTPQDTRSFGGHLDTNRYRW